MADSNQDASAKTWQRVAAWAWVGIPLGRGVIQTLINSMKLFWSQPAPQWAQAASPPPAGTFFADETAAGTLA